MSVKTVQKKFRKMNILLDWLIDNQPRLTGPQIRERVREIEKVKKSLMKDLGEVMGLAFPIWFNSLEEIDRLLDDVRATARATMGANRWSAGILSGLRSAKRSKEKLEKRFNAKHSQNEEDGRRGGGSRRTGR